MKNCLIHLQRDFFMLFPITTHYECSTKYYYRHQLIYYIGRDWLSESMIVIASLRFHSNQLVFLLCLVSVYARMRAVPHK